MRVCDPDTSELTRVEDERVVVYVWALTSLVVAIGGISSPHNMVDHSGIVVSM